MKNVEDNYKDYKKVNGSKSKDKNPNKGLIAVGIFFVVIFIAGIVAHTQNNAQPNIGQC